MSKKIHLEEAPIVIADDGTQNKTYDFLLNTLDNASNPFVVTTPWTDLYYHQF